MLQVPMAVPATGTFHEHDTATDAPPARVNDDSDPEAPTALFHPSARFTPAISVGPMATGPGPPPGAPPTKSTLMIGWPGDPPLPEPPVAAPPLPLPPLPLPPPPPIPVPPEATAVPPLAVAPPPVPMLVVPPPPAAPCPAAPVPPVPPFAPPIPWPPT